MMTTRRIILNEISRIAVEQKKSLAPLRDETELVSIGLDSLCFAILVARLEELLFVDPFSAEDVRLPVTLGDFFALYAPQAEDAESSPFGWRAEAAST